MEEDGYLLDSILRGEKKRMKSSSLACVFQLSHNTDPQTLIDEVSNDWSKIGTDTHVDGTMIYIYIDHISVLHLLFIFP